MFQNKIKIAQCLDVSGKVISGKDMPKVSANVIKKMYEMMVLPRLFDETAIKLQREGRILTYASLRGQEASQIGSALALSDEDWFCPTYREHGVFIARGFPLDMLYQYWAGDERGMEIPGNIKALPVAIPVASQIPQAVGLAWAEKLKGTKSAAVAYFGDGATSKGDFHEAMNFAGVFKIPCVFFCQNNQWAISAPRTSQTASATIAEKAFAYGFEGILADGNDVFAVYGSVKTALEKSGAGKGPTLIEAQTYRMENHTTADDWKRYRSEKEVQEWEKKDPLERLRKYMRSKKLWTKEYEAGVRQDAEAKVKEAVSKFESAPPPKPEDMFKNVYSALTPELSEQQKDFL